MNLNEKSHGENDEESILAYKEFAWTGQPTV